MTNIEVLEGAGWGTGIALQAPTQPYPTPGTPLLPVTAVHVPGMQSAELNSAVGSNPSDNSLKTSNSQGSRVLPRSIT